jgi:hypothetical protein
MKVGETDMKVGETDMKQDETSMKVRHLKLLYLSRGYPVTFIVK